MKKFGIILASLMGLALGSTPVLAESSSINYQAYLTDNDGSPVDAVVTVQFDAYNSDLGGTPLWSQNQITDADQGLISVVLGSPINPFPPELFDSSVFIAITINGEELEPRRQLLSSAFSFKSANSELLNGLPAANFDQSSEVDDLQDQTSDQEIRIASIEASPSDITAVVAGDGLTGGAQSGSATLSIAPGGVTAANMSFNAITGGAIQAGAVNSIKIEDGTIASIDLATDSIDSSKIVNGSIVAEDVGTFALTGNNLAPFAIGSFQLANGAVTPEKVQDNSLAGNKISDNSLRSIDIFDGTIESVDIASGGVAPSNLDDNAIYTIGGLNVQGSASVEGPLLLSAGANSIGDITIADNFSQVRFFNADQSQEKAALIVGNTISLNDVQNNRTIIESKSTGIGIGTTQLSPTPITMASTTISGSGTVTGQFNAFGNASVGGDLSVSGSLDVGYLVVEAPIQAIETYLCGLLNQCTAFGAQALCPSGFWPVGGGYDVNTTTPNLPSITKNGISASNPRAWECIYQDTADENAFGSCHAICLRIEGP